MRRRSLTAASSRTRRPTLAELDGDSFDDYEVMQSGQSDKGAGSAARLAGGSKQHLPTLGSMKSAAPYRHAAPLSPLGHLPVWDGDPAERAGAHTGAVCVLCGRLQMLPLEPPVRRCL